MAVHHVVMNTTLQETLDLAGIFVFAISGALVAVRKHFDLVGMLVLAEITALGGGVIRDLIIGAVPPVAFRDAGYLLMPVAATLIVLFGYGMVERVSATINIFDAAGLGLFAVSGAAKATAYGLGPLQAAALGTITAIGGGVLRDVLATESPNIFRAESELYAIPAAMGSGVVVIAQHLGIYGPDAAGGAAIFTFLLRIAGWRFGWGAPHVRSALDQRSR